MSIEFVLFEKKSENDRPVWNEDLVKTFCREQELEYQDIKDETIFFVVRLQPESEDPERRYRLLEVTETISFIIKDDPSLDEIMDFAFPNKPLPDLKDLTIEDDKKED